MRELFQLSFFILGTVIVHAHPQSSKAPLAKPQRECDRHDFVCAGLDRYGSLGATDLSTRMELEVENEKR